MLIFEHTNGALGQMLAWTDDLALFTFESIAIRASFLRRSKKSAQNYRTSIKGKKGFFFLAKPCQKRMVASLLHTLHTQRQAACEGRERQRETKNLGLFRNRRLLWWIFLFQAHLHAPRRRCLIRVDNRGERNSPPSPCLRTRERFGRARCSIHWIFLTQ